MEYKEIGKTGIVTSRIGFGAEWMGRYDTQHCVDMVNACRERGINIFDCWMSNPKIRTNLGIAVKDQRKEWYIQGHFGSTWQDEQYVRTRDMKDVVPAWDDLLTRLQTDYIDFGMIHYVDDMEDWNHLCDNGFLDFVMDMKSQGVVKHIGLSTHNPKIGRMVVESGLVEMIMFAINPGFDIIPSTGKLADLYAANTADASLKNIDPDRALLYKMCEEKNIGITVMKPFGGGRLFSAERSAFGVPLTPIQCLHYCLTRPGVCSVMVGAEEIAHIEEAVSYFEADDKARDYASVLANAPKHAFRGQCTYCGHCMPCVQNIDIAMVNKFYDLASMQQSVPESIRNHYELLKAHAGDCIGCRQCEPNCPFGVRISERMPMAAELFGL